MINLNSQGDWLWPNAADIKCMFRKEQTLQKR